MIKVVAIMGSPHAGNSLDVTRRIEKKLKQLGPVEFDLIQLKDVDLQPCRGCFACFLRRGEPCPARDERQAIVEKIDAADGLLMVTPVYAMHVSYLLKLFIDRLACYFHRPRWAGKRAMSVGSGRQHRHQRDTRLYGWGRPLLGHGAGRSTGCQGGAQPFQVAHAEQRQGSLRRDGRALLPCHAR